MGHDPDIRITGGDGQVGRALRELLPEARILTRAELDITDAVAAREMLSGADVVIHCAAMTDVDGCERDPAAAQRVNADGAANVAAAGARTIMLSTDYVFDGRSQVPYREDDATNPQSAYGRSKLEGERAVLAAGPHNLVVRTSWVYGEGRNFFRAILAADAAGKPLRVVSNQYGRPTNAADLAAALVVLAEAQHAGIVHVTGDGEPVSWADLAEIAVGHPVGRVTTAEWGAPAPRPPRSVLALDRARSLGVPLSDWRESLNRYLEELA